MSPKPDPSMISLTPWKINGAVKTNSVTSRAVVYPNPANDVLKIQNLQPEVKKHFEIYDLLGIKHIDLTGTESMFSLSIGNLKPGCYILKVTTECNTIAKQFIKL